MKRMLIIAILAVGMTAASGYAQMMHEGMMQGQTQQQTDQTTRQGWYGPYQHMMGPGMMGYGAGYGMGPGMMGHGMGYGMMGPGMMGYGMGPGMMGHHYMMHGGPGMMGYGTAPCASGTWGYDQATYNKFLDDTKDLRKKLHDKKFQYQETVRDPETTQETITKLQKEMQDLQNKINEKYPK